jgi:hypothetical protein
MPGLGAFPGMPPLQSGFGSAIPGGRIAMGGLGDIDGSRLDTESLKQQ